MSYLAALVTNSEKERHAGMCMTLSVHSQVLNSMREEVLILEERVDESALRIETLSQSIEGA